MSRALLYSFTYNTLKSYFFEYPEYVFNRLNRNDVYSKVVLISIWENTLEALNIDEEEDSLWEELDLKATKINDELEIIIIHLPEPIEPVEAWFVALTRQQKGDTDKYRFFTLEYGLDPDYKPVTVFCELNNSSHSNYGDGPEPNAELFLKKVIDFLEQEET
jgi:hypothetical protein